VFVLKTPARELILPPTSLLLLILIGALLIGEPMRRLLSAGGVREKLDQRAGK
jgi:hypothetical protein